jgi:tetratricopeptide (TPR) repeat protein
MQEADIQTGLDLHKRSVKRYPGVAATWFNFGVSLHKQAQIMATRSGPISAQLLDSAISYYSRAIDVDTRSTLAWIYRGAIRARRGEHELARSDWQIAIANDPGHLVSEMVQILLQVGFTPQMKELLGRNRLADDVTVCALVRSVSAEPPIWK